MEKLTKIEPFVENVSGTQSAVWRVVCRCRTGPACVGTFNSACPHLPSLFIFSNHQQTIVTKYLWNLNIKCGSDGALNREVPFHLKRSGTCKRPGGIGPRASFDLIFVISWIICVEKLNLTTWSKRKDGNMIVLGWESRRRKPWHYLHWELLSRKLFSLWLILLFCLDKLWFLINCLWLTVRQHGKAQSPFLGPWGPLLAMDKKVPKNIRFYGQKGT